MFPTSLCTEDLHQESITLCCVTPFRLGGWTGWVRTTWGLCCHSRGKMDRQQLDQCWPRLPTASPVRAAHVAAAGISGAAASLRHPPGPVTTCMHFIRLAVHIHLQVHKHTVDTRRSAHIYVNMRSTHTPRHAQAHKHCAGTCTCRYTNNYMYGRTYIYTLERLIGTQGYNFNTCTCGTAYHVVFYQYLFMNTSKIVIGDFIAAALYEHREGETREMGWAQRPLKIERQGLLSGHRNELKLVHFWHVFTWYIFLFQFLCQCSPNLFFPPISPNHYIAKIYIAFYFFHNPQLGCRCTNLYRHTLCIFMQAYRYMHAY